MQKIQNAHHPEWQIIEICVHLLLAWGRACHAVSQKILLIPHSQGDRAESHPRLLIIPGRASLCPGRSSL